MTHFVLKIRFPALDAKSTQAQVQALRTFRFAQSTTVREAIDRVRA